MEPDCHPASRTLDHVDRKQYITDGTEDGTCSLTNGGLKEVRELSKFYPEILSRIGYISSSVTPYPDGRQPDDGTITYIHNIKHEVSKGGSPLLGALEKIGGS